MRWFHFFRFIVFISLVIPCLQVTQVILSFSLLLLFGLIGSILFYLEALFYSWRTSSILSVFGLVDIIIRFKGGHMFATCCPHVLLCITVQCCVHSLLYCITHSFSSHLLSLLLEQHLTVICGLAQGQFPRYKYSVMGSHKKTKTKGMWIEYYIDFDYTSQLSGESKRIRLEYKYATRGFIY